jgi:hypothetical protein
MSPPHSSVILLTTRRLPQHSKSKRTHARTSVRRSRRLTYHSQPNFRTLQLQPSVVVTWRLNCHRTDAIGDRARSYLPQCSDCNTVHAHVQVMLNWRQRKLTGHIQSFIVRYSPLPSCPLVTLTYNWWLDSSTSPNDTHQPKRVAAKIASLRNYSVNR